MSCFNILAGFAIETYGNMTIICCLHTNLVIEDHFEGHLPWFFFPRDIKANPNQQINIFIIIKLTWICLIKQITRNISIHISTNLSSSFVFLFRICIPRNQECLADKITSTKEFSFSELKKMWSKRKRSNFEAFASRAIKNDWETFCRQEFEIWARIKNYSQFIKI